MQEKRKRSMAERKIQAEVQLSEKAKVQERLLALEAYRRSQGNNAAAQEEVCSFTVQGISSQSVYFLKPPDRNTKSSQLLRIFLWPFS